VTSYANYVLETLLTLAAVCGLAVVVLWSARRMGVGRPRGPVALLGRLPLEGRRAVYVVRVGGQALVVGASEAGLTRLGEVPLGELGDTSAPAPPTFADALAKVLGRASGVPAPAASAPRDEAAT